MAKEKILVIEDDEDIQELVRYNLSREGYDVHCAGSGEEGLREAIETTPDLVVLDLMLPGMSGMEVCRRLKSDAGTRHLPVMMLTAKDGESDVVTGLEAGADDYMTKPFSTRILVARVRAVLRKKMRDLADQESVVRIHDLVINPGRREVLAAEEKVELTFTEFSVLNLLARRPGWVFSRYQIIDAIRGEGYPVTDRAVDVQIAGLRKKLGACGTYIETVRGVGYRFKS